jgi:membrane protease YdiL (CAAX protease family)
MQKRVGTDVQLSGGRDTSAASPWSLPELRIAAALLLAVAIVHGTVWALVEPPLTYWAWVLPGATVQLALAGAAWTLLIWRRHVPPAAIGLQPPRLSAVALAVGLAVVDLIFGYWYVLLLDVIAPGSLSSGGSQLSPLEFCAELLRVAVVAPIVEEFLFRGLLFTGLRHHWGPLRAALVSSALFACFHFDLLLALHTFVGGLLFAIAYQRTGSMWAAALAHSLSNSLFLVLSAMGQIP